MVFLWNLSESQSPQVSGTLLCIPADLNKAVVWIVSTRSSYEFFIAVLADGLSLESE